jgi:DnaJ like chaperone protein
MFGLAHERQKVMEFIRQTSLGLREKRRLSESSMSPLPTGGLRAFATQFYQNFSHAPNILQLMIDIFYRVASADGQVSQREEDMIRRAAQIFHLPESFVDMLCNRYGGCTNASDKAYATLNISRTATDDEVKRAYRKLSIEFHPDSLASKGMGEEFLTHATAKFREIQEAYDSIKRERGIK